MPFVILIFTCLLLKILRFTLLSMVRAEDLIYVPRCLMGVLKPLEMTNQPRVIRELIFSQPSLILLYFSSQFQGEERSKSGDFIKVVYSPFLLGFVYLIWGQNCILKEELVNLIRVLSSTPDFARTDFAKGLVKSS